MHITELPLHHTTILAPCDVVERTTGRDERISVRLPIEIPLDEGRDIPIAARFAGMWPMTRFTHGPTYHGRDQIDAAYIKCGKDLMAPIQVLGFKHIGRENVAEGLHGIVLRNYDAFVDLATTMRDKDGLLLEWNNRPHVITGRRFDFTPARGAPERLDGMLRRRFEFDETFAERIRDFIRRNFVMRPDGLFARMPLPSWRLLDNQIGLDPFPRYLEGWASGFRLDRLEDAHRMARRLFGRRADQAIAAPVAAVVELGDVLADARDDLAIIAKSAVPPLLADAEALLPQMPREAVQAWHLGVAQSGESASHAERAKAFVTFADAAAHTPLSATRDRWLNRASAIHWRLSEIELPRHEATPAFAPKAA